MGVSVIVLSAVSKNLVGCNSGEERFILQGSECRSILAGKAWQQELEEADHTPSRKSDKCCALLTFPLLPSFIRFGTLSSWDGAKHIQGGCSLLS